MFTRYQLFKRYRKVGMSLALSIKRSFITAKFYADHG